VVLRLSPIDTTYLDLRHADDSSVSLAIVGHAGLLAAVGGQPAGTDGIRVASRVLATGASASRLTTGWFVAAVPIQAGDRTTVAALVVSAPTSSVDATRDRLFRTLALIALGGTLLALGLAAIVGDRITAGLRRLTHAAESIQRGDSRERARVAGPDEVGVLGAAFDSMADAIQDQTTALQEAADDESRLRSRLEAVVAGMGDALVAIDADGRVTDFNRAAEDLMGLDAAAALGQSAAEVLALVDEDGVSLGDRVRSHQAPWGGLATLMQPLGGEVPVAVSIGAVEGPGRRVVGRVLVLRDLRREHEVERMKAEFLSRAGHELRTPLTGILGYARVLLRRQVGAGSGSPVLRGDRRGRQAVAADRGDTRVFRLVRRGAHGPRAARRAPHGGGGRGRLGPPAAGTHRISHHLGGDIPDVLGDRRWLVLAIDELIDNAVKFSPEGGSITVTARVTPMGADLVEGVGISVADEGQGMTPEQRTAAFGEFVQGDPSDTRRFGGLGLGLSLVQRVVEGHGGTVSCVSTAGQGSVFTISLPAMPDEALIQA
jgi:PAS domain S-box-containing protein